MSSSKHYQKLGNGKEHDALLNEPERWRNVAGLDAENKGTGKDSTTNCCLNKWMLNPFERPYDLQLLAQDVAPVLFRAKVSP